MPRRTVSAPPLKAALALLLSLTATGGSAAPAPITLTLREALDIALANNLDLDGATRGVSIADQGVRSARGAFDPLFTLFYQHSKDVQPQASTLEANVSQTVRDNFNTRFSQALWHGGKYEVALVGSRFESNNPFQSLSPSYNADVMFSFTQPLLKGLGRDANRRGVLQAMNAVSIAQADLGTRARMVAQDTVDAYWELVFARENLEVRRGSLGLADSLLRKNRIMVEVGTLAPLEISQAEAAVAQRRQDIIVGEAAVGNAEDALRRILGADHGPVGWDAPLVPAETPEFVATYVDLREALEVALQDRPELRAAQLRVENTELQTAWARDQVRPQLDLGLTLSTAGLGGDARDFVDTDGDTIPDTFVRLTNENFHQAFEQVGDREFNSWATSLTYSQPIFNRPAKAAYQTARLNLEQGRLDLAKLRQTVTLEVRRAVRDIDSGRERVLAAQATRELQQKTLDAEIRKFENGLSTNFEILQFQTDLTQAESGELRALVDHERAIAAYYSARGSLLAQHGLEVPASEAVFAARRDRQR